MKEVINLLKRIRSKSDKEQLEILYESLDIEPLKALSSKKLLELFIEECQNILNLDLEVWIKEKNNNSEKYKQLLYERLLTLIQEEQEVLKNIKQSLTDNNLDEIKRILTMSYNQYYLNYRNYYDSMLSNGRIEIIDDSNRKIQKDFIDNKLNEINYNSVKKQIEDFFTTENLQDIEREEFLEILRKYKSYFIRLDFLFVQNDSPIPDRNTLLNEMFEGTQFYYAKREDKYKEIQSLKEAEKRNIDKIKKCLSSENIKEYYLLFRISNALINSLVDDMATDIFDTISFDKGKMINRIIGEKIDEFLKTDKKPYVKD